MGIRLTVLIFGVILLYAALVFNMYRLQIEQGSFYAAQAESQYFSSGSLKAARGKIYFTDKNNNLIPAAINKKYPKIFAVPQEIKNKEQTAKALSEALNLDYDELLRKLRKPQDQYELLINKANQSQIEAVQKSNLEGVYIEHQEYRMYPFGKLAAHVLGFVGESREDNKMAGRYGVERFFETKLAGVPGRLDKDEIIDPVDGEDIVLSIDRNIQAMAEEILNNLIEKYKAEGGTVIVQNPRTGKILAMGSAPSFDPNSFSKYPISTFSNPAVEAIYEPGSIFKIITMAAALDAGKVTPETTYYDSGTITLDGKTISNWDFKKYGPHGKVNMTEVIEHSINTGAVFVQQKLGQDLFYNYLREFGFDTLTGIKLPNEVAGTLKNLKNGFRDIDFATASFGQGVAVTPIELITAVSTIANDGVMMKPLILRDEKPEVIRRVISPEAAHEVTKMMVSAVKKARVAYIPNYTVAGKTGTALVPDFHRGGYTEEVINTYAGFAPASNPRFTILIKLVKPAGAPLAGQTVVPAFKELAQFILNYYNIPPDDL